MRKTIVISTLLVLAMTCNALAKDDPGELWSNVREDVKAAYIVGTEDGQLMAHLIWSDASSDLCDGYDIDVVGGAEDVYYSQFKRHHTITSLRLLMDEFYKDSKNSKIAWHIALYISKQQADGKSVNDLIDRHRKLAESLDRATAEQ